MKYLAWLPMSLVLLFVYTNCAEDGPSGKASNDPIFSIENPVFPNSEEITVTITPSRGSTAPDFRWSAGLRPIDVLYIFNERIDINRSSFTIENMENAVWTWNSQMETGRVGTVSYWDGVNLQAGIIVEGIPVALTDGAYYVCLLGYDQQLFPKWSSKEMVYYTEPEPTTSAE